jgi:hypothetical protein
MKKFITIAIMALTIAAVAGPAQAITADELQAQIVALTAQLAQLQAQLGQVGGTGPTACAITSFARNLSQGTSGADVQCLQRILNSAADTMVASSGVGSPGSETTYFGALTKAAVVKFQNKYASEILAPVGLTAGTGFVGPATRPKLNTMIGGGGIIPPPPITGPGLTVALAADNPISTTLVDNQSVAPLAKYTFTNGNNTATSVTQLKLIRRGVSADTDIDNVYLFNGANRLTDAASVSSGIITFNDSTGIFTVPAYSSMAITVAADIHTGISGVTIGAGINAASDITAGTTINGIFPLNGNLMTVASADLATLDFTAAPTPTGTPTINPQNDYAIWQITPAIGARAVNLTRVSLREIGSINYSDLQNFRLYVDGVQVGSAVQNIDSKGYITFDLSSAPKRLETGSRTLKVLTDIINGSSRTFSFSLRVAADINLIDTQYNVNVRPTVSSSTFTARTTGTVTVGSGTLTLQKDTTSPAGNIINNGANVILAKYKLTAAGEKVKVETLYVSVNVVSTADADKGGSTAASDVGWLRNGALYANGVQIGSTSNLYEDSYSTTYTTFNLGSSLVVEPGNPVILEVRADVYDGDGTTSADAGKIIATDKITVRVEGSTDWNNAQGMSSLTTTDVPSTDQDANQLIVAAGGLTLTKYTAYTDQTMVAPINNAKLAHFTLTANTTEAVNLNTISLDLDGAVVTGDFTAVGDVTNLYVKYGNIETQKTATLSSATSNSYSINYTLPAGQTIDMIVYGDVDSDAYLTLTSTGRVDMTITGTTANSGAAADAAEVTGQTISFSTGTFAAVKAGDSPIAQALAGSQTITSARFKFTAVSDAYTIRELKFTVGTDAISAVIAYAGLYDGGTQIGSNIAWDSENDRFYFTGLSIPVSANTSKTLDVKLTLVEPSSDYSTSQVNVATTLAWMKYAATSSSTETSDDNPSNTSSIVNGVTLADPVGSAIYVYKTIPTFTAQSLPSTVLTTGTSQTLYKFSIAADAKGPVAVKQLKFTTTITAGSETSSQNLDYFKFLRGSDDISSLVTILNAAEADLEVDGTGCTEAAACTVTVTFATEETIAAGSSATYSLKATSAGMGSSTAGKDSVSTSLLGDAAGHNGTSKYLNLDENVTINGLYTSAAASADATAYNAIWSDNSAIGHSSTTGTASSGDWANGYLIKDLPLDAMSLINP